ncbi:MAG: hypothetical protein AAF998_24215 [Bacteroidota bacterium]
MNGEDYTAIGEATFGLMTFGALLTMAIAGPVQLMMAVLKLGDPKTKAQARNLRLYFSGVLVYGGGLLGLLLNHGSILGSPEKALYTILGGLALLVFHLVTTFHPAVLGGE